MNTSALDPVRKRNVVLRTGITMLVIAVLDEPSALLLFTSRIGLIKLALYVISGCCFAHGITIAAEGALKSPIEPWYARPGGLLFLLLAMGVALLGWLLVGAAMTALVGLPRTDRFVYLCSLTGLTFIWITLQRWASYVE